MYKTNTSHTPTNCISGDTDCSLNQVIPIISVLMDGEKQLYSSGVVGGIAVGCIICTFVLCLIVHCISGRRRQNKSKFNVNTSVVVLRQNKGQFNVNTSVVVLRQNKGQLNVNTSVVVLKQNKDQFNVNTSVVVLRQNKGQFNVIDLLSF